MNRFAPRCPKAQTSAASSAASCDIEWRWANRPVVFTLVYLPSGRVETRRTRERDSARAQAAFTELPSSFWLCLQRGPEGSRKWVLGLTGGANGLGTLAANAPNVLLCRGADS